MLNNTLAQQQSNMNLRERSIGIQYLFVSIVTTSMSSMSSSCVCFCFRCLFFAVPFCCSRPIVFYVQCVGCLFCHRRFSCATFDNSQLTSLLSRQRTQKNDIRCNIQHNEFFGVGCSQTQRILRSGMNSEMFDVEMSTFRVSIEYFSKLAANIP